MRNWCIILVLILSACQQDVPVPLNSVNQLDVGDAVLPIHIHGRQSSSSVLLVVNGGPGASAILLRNNRGFHLLEQEVRIAYLDQRGCGISEGNVDPSSITTEQWAEDIHAAVQFLLASDPGLQVFIMGLDWGNAAVLEYLTGPSGDDRVEGYLAVAPCFQAAENMQRSRQGVIDLAESALNDSDPSNDGAAQNILDYYAVNTAIDRFNYEEHFRLLDGLSGITLSANNPVEDVTAPEYLPASLDHNGRFALEHLSANDGHFLEGLNNEAALSDVDVPVKLIWGDGDLLMPRSMAFRYLNLLPSDIQEERISFFPASAHRPYLEEGERFFATIAAWIAIHN